MVLEQVTCRDVKIVMGDMNAKVGMDNTGREEVMGKHGARAEMNDYGERWADFCQANELVIGGMPFPPKECHKRTWRSPDVVIGNQIDHLVFNKKWRSTLQDICVLRGADIGSDYPMLMANLRLKIAKVRKGESGLVRFEVSMLKDFAFKLALHDRFEGRSGHVRGGSFGPLQQDME
ncbi:craniofacial development protein 2-like [Montipora foliosa]|uniref:craniofacial development protein 2-like n=1 Tax=Montipora foliosa TaxID=591990 RepID=UPI0035F15716